MATTFLSCSVLMMNFPLLLALNQTTDQIRFGTFSLHLSVILGFFSCSFSSSQTCQHICPCPNNTAGEDSFMFFFWHQNTINPYALQTGTHLWSYISQCVYMCVCECVSVCVFLLLFYLTTESVTNGCVRAWWSTAIALLGTKLLQDYIDSPKEKSCFNQPHIIWETKKDVQLFMERVALSSSRKTLIFFFFYYSMLALWKSWIQKLLSRIHTRRASPVTANNYLRVICGSQLSFED